MSGGEPAPAGLSAARASIELLRGRVARLPACLAEVASRRWDAAIGALGDDVVVTGVGASAGPARLFAWMLAHRLGVRARFSPISAFAGGAPPEARAALPRGRALVVVSQSLSPNARLALRHAAAFERVLVLTSTPPAQHGAARLLADIEARGGAVVVLPPDEEDGTLLRVVGPAVAAVAACAIVERARVAGRFSASIARRSEAPGAALARAPGDVAADFAHDAGDFGDALGRLYEVIASAGERALRAAAHVASEALDGACAFVSVGVDPAALQGHRWKWLEGLRAGEPFGWDLLEIAHGPIQAAGAPMPFVVLTSAGDGAAGLVERLGRVLAGAGHPLVELSSALPFPLSFADHDAQLDALLLRVLDDRPRDLRTAACAAHDEPLYGLGR